MDRSGPSHRHLPHLDSSAARLAARLGVHGVATAAGPPDPAVSAIARAVPIVDRAEFVAAPVGRTIVGPTYVIWCETPDLMGVTVWGDLTEASIREMMAIGAFVRHPDVAARRRVLVDCRDVTRADAEVLLAFTAMAHEQVSQWSREIERQVVLVPDGVAGILLAGALSAFGAEHQVRVARELDTALAYLDHPAARAAHAAAADLAARMGGRSALVFELRAHLAHDLLHATLETSAAALGTSTRTLQRELRRLGTSFSDELRLVRVATAESLLLHSDYKIGVIAAQVGFGTASRMSAALRRDRDVTASALRARLRG